MTPENPSALKPAFEVTDYGGQQLANAQNQPCRHILSLIPLSLWALHSQKMVCEPVKDPCIDRQQ